jgi:hypothetical protein
VFGVVVKDDRGEGAGRGHEGEKAHGTWGFEDMKWR